MSDTVIQREPADIRARIQAAAGLSLDRLPILQLIFDRLATACGENLKHRVASTVIYALSGTESGRIGDFVYDASSERPRYIVETEEGRQVAQRAEALRASAPGGQQTVGA